MLKQFLNTHYIKLNGARKHTTHNSRLYSFIYLMFLVAPVSIYSLLTGFTYCMAYTMILLTHVYWSRQQTQLDRTGK